MTISIAAGSPRRVTRHNRFDLAPERNVYANRILIETDNQRDNRHTAKRIGHYPRPIHTSMALDIALHVAASSAASSSGVAENDSGHPRYADRWHNTD